LRCSQMVSSHLVCVGKWLTVDSVTTQRSPEPEVTACTAGSAGTAAYLTCTACTPGKHFTAGWRVTAGQAEARQRHVMQPEQQQAALSAITEQWGPEQRNDYMQQQAAIWDDIQRSRTVANVPSQPSASVGLPQNASGSNATPGAAIAADDNGSSKASVHHTQSSGSGSVAAADVCSACMDAQKDWVCIPCGHLAMCKDCSVRVGRLTGRCPICSQRIKQVMQVYRT